MRATRREMALGLAALTLAGCGGSAPRSAPPQAMRAVPNPGFDAWMAGALTRAEAQGISDRTLTAARAQAGYLPGVIERDRNQAEFSRSLEDYLALVASEEQVTNGRAALARNNSVLNEIAARYRVEPHVVCAVWGVESRYGARRGDIPVIPAVATLAYDGRRRQLFESQLMAALKILDDGDVTPAGMTGSWAGAMGHTQFIPTSYEAFAVDFRGDGRRDIWSEDPTDALASTAAYLSRSGWQQGQPWGLEVVLPAGFDTGQTGRGTRRSSASWAGQGVRPARGGALPDHGAASILIPSGASGPAFIVFGNFTVITRYNNAESYVIGVGYLSDRLAGGGPLRTPFPPDAQGLTIDDRRELQSRLTAAGFDTQGADGVIGDNTRSAITAYQRRNGLPVTGTPSSELLARLRGA